MAVPLGRTWIGLRFPDPLFYAGVHDFLAFAKMHLCGINKIRCPCNQCKNTSISRSYDEVEFHLIRFGFSSTYTVWEFHGEVGKNEVAQNPSSSHGLHSDSANLGPENGGNTSSKCHKMPEIVGEPNNNGQDNTFDESSDVEKFMKRLYPGSDLTVGSFVVKIFDLKVRNGFTDKGLGEVLNFIKEILPSNNEVPPSLYHAEKLVDDVSLRYEKIHACRNDCILYWDKYADLQECPTCHAPRYKIEKISNKYPVRKPAKVLWYFPITQRLERMYSVPWVAKEMSWHKNGKLSAGKMGHPVDSSVWKTFDFNYPDFKSDARNVRLGLATDGFNPFGNFSSSYSCWPVMCVPYNLPPHLCMRPEFTMLTLLIEGPKQLGDDIDVYLQPLLKELEDLWDEGVEILDASIGLPFTLRAALLWTAHMNQGLTDKGKKCDIHAWDTLVVARGEVVEVDPKAIAHNVVIGEGNYKILVETVIDGEAILFRPNSQVQTIAEVCGGYAVWSKKSLTLYD